MTHDPREALKPCPFCGSEAELLDGGPGNWFVRCKNCKCSTNDVQRDAAVQLWHRRSALIASPGEQQPVAHRIRVVDGSYCKVIPDGELETWKQNWSMHLKSGYALLEPLYLSAPPAAGWDEEYPFDDERFNKGVQHVVDMLARELGVTDWIAGDGSEDYDCDLWQTILNILAAKGLYDKDEGKFYDPTNQPFDEPFRHVGASRPDFGDRSPPVGGYGSIKAAINAADANARTCKGFASALERIRDGEPNAPQIALDALRMPWAVSGLPSDPTADRRDIVARVKANPGDGTVAPDIAHVLARGFHAMGWGRPQHAAEDMIDAIITALDGGAGA